jgi:hypothetical protein
VAARRVVEIDPRDPQGPASQRGPSVREAHGEPWYADAQRDMDRIREALDELELEELVEERELLKQHWLRASEATSATRDQLSNVNDQHAAGVRDAPYEWLRRARTAKRLAGRMVLELQTLMGDINRRIKALRQEARKVVTEDDTQVDVATVRRLWVQLGIVLGELDPDEV